MTAADYTLEENAYWSERVYSHVFRLLNEYGILMEGMLLKPNMCLPGLDVPTPPPQEVARYTVRTMLRSIPPAVPGIHFLSGGMSAEESTLNLQVRHVLLMHLGAIPKEVMQLLVTTMGAKDHVGFRPVMIFWKI